ncbi:cellulose-binding GDSL lipase acylhydrolase [Fusarium phyllophilum]|uniref:Cellulose-binding GDSL lipase acylhydrolase n=1 Tax=Fusarium phyllophilum TaxID=47803 RepID=A0A8H5K0D0_9HYPO|nr:cellulose-binding GDSL lipase acylhydrolase [Fusarium phyllophilum]
MSHDKVSARLLTTVIFITGILVFLALPFLPGRPKQHVVRPVKISFQAEEPNEPNEPNERYLIAFGDSYSRSGFRTNYTYTRTGPGVDDMERTEKPKDERVNAPSALNPIGNPALPGNTSSGGQNWATYMTTEFNTTLTLAYIFARSASVVDAEIIPSRSKSSFSFAQQIVHFQDAIGHRPHYAAWTEKNIVATVWFGFNDLSVVSHKKGQGAVLAAANRRIFELSQILYDTGIRNFIFIEIPPKELFPSHQAHKDNDTHHSYEMVSYAVNRWNSLLRQNTVRFRKSHPDAKVTYVEIWDIFYEAFLRPQDVGAPNSTCVDPSGKGCLWANTGHPGEKIHQLIGARVAEKAWG